MKGKIQYDFSAEIWQYDAKGSSYFVSLPQNLSREIREKEKLKTGLQIDVNLWI